MKKIVLGLLMTSSFSAFDEKLVTVGKIMVFVATDKK